MQDLLGLIEKYEEKNGYDCISVRIFSDGSGTIQDYGHEIFSFDKTDELIKFLEA